MVRGLLLWAAGNPRLERTITENPILSKATHCFRAGERLDEALETAARCEKPMECAGEARGATAMTTTARSTPARYHIKSPKNRL